ncbi:MAG: PAS domain S-box protein [Anaerolineales bacterium]|nr:PAS domain S-box protein [Anaerolineales bacterium]
MIRILLVEDNEDDYILVSEVLSVQNFQIDWCGSASSARVQLVANQYDLVLLDHGLPDTNSLSFLDEITQAHAQLPVVILTGRHDKALAVSAIKKGAASYLLKDEIFSHLYQTVVDCLPASPAIEPPAEHPADNPLRFVDTAEHIYRLLLEAMSEGCIVIGRDGIISFVNDAIGHLAGQESHLLLGEHLVKIFAPPTRNAVEEILGTGNTSNWVPASLEGKIQRADKQEIPVLISIYHLEDETGPYRGDWLLVLTDISHQIESQIALEKSLKAEQEQRSRLHALIESSRDGIILVGVDLNITVINSTALELLGLPGESERWTGRSFASLSQGQPRGENNFGHTLHAEFRRLHAGDVTPGKGTFRSPSRVIDWASLPVDQSGQSYGRMFLLQDVTEQKQLEGMRELLTNTMVHDLRSPLATIHSTLEYVLELAGDDLARNHRQMLDVAFRSAGKMLDLVSNILEVSRLESGEMPVSPYPYPVEYLVNAAVEQILPQAVAKEIEIIVERAEKTPMVLVDQILVERIMQNLLDNAIKFTPSGGYIQVRVRKLAGNEDESFVEIEVCDSGNGIPDEIIDSIFDKFATGNAEESGTGLGLAFCKLAVFALGGEITVRNHPEGGAIFRFTLPATLDNE